MKRVLLLVVLASAPRVPQDIAAIGCGNVRNAELLRVPLRSVDRDSAGIGRQAARLALSLLESRVERPRPKTMLLRPKIVAREPTRRRT